MRYEAGVNRGINQNSKLLTWANAILEWMFKFEDRFLGKNLEIKFGHLEVLNLQVEVSNG